MTTFPRYDLSEKQIRGIARIVDCEQGTTAGEYAEASLMANRTDIAGDDKATVSRLIKTVTGGWFAYGLTRYREGYNGTENVPQHAIDAVVNVLVKGKRTLPRFVNEHDCLPDITTVTNGTKSNKKAWVRGKTILKNRYGSSWYFWDFPGGYDDDPFGYTSSAYRKKWGDSCYTFEQAKDDAVKVKSGYSGVFPALPDRGYYQYGDGITTLTKHRTQIKRMQMVCNWATGSAYAVDGKYGADTVKLVKKLENQAGLEQDGKFGKKCLAYVKALKK